MGGVVSAIGDAIGGAVEAVGKVVETVVENPLPIIVAVAAPELAVAMGVPTPVATAAISATTTAVQGGDFGDIIKSATAAGVGSYVGGVVGKSATDYAAANIPSVSANIVGKVAGGAAGAATGGLIATGDVGTALKYGVLGGASAGALEAGKALVSGAATGTTTPGVADTSGTPAAGTSVPTSPYGTTELVSATSPFGTTGTINQPSFSYPGSTYTPTFWESDTGKALAKAGESVASTGTRSQLADLLGLTPSYSGGTTSSTATPGSTIASTGQGSYSPGTAALGQALRVDPGATLGGGDQKAPQNVWNLASLRVKDETGG